MKASIVRNALFATVASCALACSLSACQKSHSRSDSEAIHSRGVGLLGLGRFWNFLHNKGLSFIPVEWGGKTLIALAQTSGSKKTDVCFYSLEISNAQIDALRDSSNSTLETYLDQFKVLPAGSYVIQADKLDAFEQDSLKELTMAANDALAAARPFCEAALRHASSPGWYPQFQTCSTEDICVRRDHDTDKCTKHMQKETCSYDRLKDPDARECDRLNSLARSKQGSIEEFKQGLTDLRQEIRVAQSLDGAAKVEPTQKTSRSRYNSLVNVLELTNDWMASHGGKALCSPTVKK